MTPRGVAYADRKKSNKSTAFSLTKTFLCDTVTAGSNYMAMTNNSMMKILIAMIALSFIVSSCKNRGWQFSANEYDLRTAQITAEGSSNGRAIHTMLSVECSPGPGGTIGINYFVYNVKSAGSFNFDAFEGPDAPASSKKLVDIDVVTSHGTIKVKTAVSGSYAEYDVFRFGLYAMNTGNSDVKRIAEALMKGANNIIITVHDMKNPALQLKTNFSALNASPAIEKTIKGCCKD